MVDVEELLRAGPRSGDERIGGEVDELARRARDADLLDVAWTMVDTPCGELLLAGSQAGLVAVGLRDPDQLLQRVADEVSPRVIEAPAQLDESRRQFDEYFEGVRTTFDLELDWTLSHGFRREVLHELVRVPYGEVVTYAELARRADKPKAVRAVGSAMATNPLPVVVPCHRVVRTGGALGNYGGGVDMKRWLLTMEGALLA
jgi:methylated-DNA-[protein]-cysteine S-methyltransferase